MHASNHQSHSSIASSLPGATSTCAAIRHGKLEISNPIPLPQKISDGPSSPIVDGQAGYKSSSSFTKMDTWPRRMTPTSLRGFSQHAGYDESVLHPSDTYNNSSNRTSAALTNTLQSMSSVPSRSSLRKSGGLRATFRRMFGSKRTRDSFSTSVNDHRMSSGNLLSNAGSTNHRPLRKPSLLFEELIRGRALNSHAPTQTPSKPTQKDDAGARYTRPRLDLLSRRNSLPSVILSTQEAQSLNLASNARGNGTDYKGLPRSLRRIPNRSLIDSMKRRSRSAEALRDKTQLQNTLQAQERRLSDEIKYWRNSVIQDPIPVFTTTQRETTDDAELDRSKSSRTSIASERPGSEDAPSRSQAFDFCALMAGDGDASVEQRVTTVEVKLMDLECAIANLQGCEVAQPVVLGKPPRRRKASQNLSQRIRTRSMSTPAIFPKSSFESYSTASSASKNMQEDIGEHRHSAANTLRPGIAAQFDGPTTVAPQPLLPAPTQNDDDVARVLSMLMQEQEARRGLESQVRDLQKQINEIRFPAALRGPPTPAHFSTPTSNFVDSSPMSAKRPAVLPFRTAYPRLNSMTAAGLREHESDETDTDDGFLDVYETPTEARDYGFGLVTPRSPPLVGVM